MKIALAQIDVKPAQPEKNLTTMLRMVERAQEAGAHLVAFPEMSLPGYLLGDLWTDESFCDDMMSFNEDVRKASKDIAIAFGNIYQHKFAEGWHPNKDGRTRKYNSVVIVQNGQYARRAKEVDLLPEGVHPKTLLPNYRIFDDERYFFSLEDVAKDFGKSLEDITQPFIIEADGKLVKVGFELCEDLWVEDYRKQGEALNPTKMLIDDGAEVIVNLSASPWTFGKNNSRDRRVFALKEKSGKRFVPFYYVNCVGAQNNGKNIVTFDGGSTIYDDEGKPVLMLPEAYKEDILLADHTALPATVERVEAPKISQKYHALVRGIRHVADIAGTAHQPKYIIGLSGGIDSAVVACLLEQAVGREKVFGITMPTQYNSEKTKNAARAVATALDIGFAELPIQDLVNTNSDLLNRFDLDHSGKKLSTLNEENVQAKIRGSSLLSNLAAKYGALFTCNGNKLEIALGYATLYGDVGGVLAPLGDLTKTEVFDLAHFLNKEIYGREVIPASLLPDELMRFGKKQIQPSAELKENQVDPMKFGYHDALLDAFTNFKKVNPETVARWYLEGTLEKNLEIPAEMIARWGIDTPKTFIDDLEWFARQIGQQVFKRVQSPPIIITSKSAYGYDIRESMLPFRTTREYEQLREKVLALPHYTTQNTRGDE